MSTSLTITPFGINLKRKNYFLTMIITNLILTLPTIIFSIPSILALYFFLKKNNCSHPYFKFYKLYLLIITIILNIIFFLFIFYFFLKIIYIKSSQAFEEIYSIIAMFFFGFLGEPLLNVYLCNVQNCYREIEVDLSEPEAKESVELEL